MVTCPNCGEGNPDRARFCLNCAAPLTTEATPAREVRKTVTIVFCDMTGSTALGDHLDPESLRKVMASYFDAMKQVLERHGGTIEKFIGDAVMAVFGIPTLHEDDALRAVRAAVEMRTALATLNQDLERNQGVTIEVRTGVNTGEVVAGDSSTSQALITGDAVNMAARLEQAARPGEILIGANTHRLVRDAIEADPIESLAVNGKATRIAAFRLHRVIAGAPALARTLDSELVGRDHELKMLTEAYERAVREQSCHLFTLLGSAGIGKSRLVAEFLLSIGNAARILQGRCLPYGEGITFWPVAEVVKQAAAVEERDAPERGPLKIASLLEGTENGQLIAEILSQAIGFKSAAASIEEIFWAVRKLFESLAGHTPLIVVFDDVHWAEPTFLDLLDHVADMSRDAPLLLLCVARDELLDQRRGWAGGKFNATTLSLEPLTAEECAALIENLLHRSELPSEAITRVIEAGEGNPLFVQEMLAMMIDEGLLARANGRWKATKALSDVSVPPTIQVLLAARLDRLAEGERSILEAASVIGKIFWRGAVTALLAEDVRSSVGARLSNLVRKDLIRPDASRFAGDDGFRFRHSLIRDAAYDSIAKRTRAGLHERFARWLENVSGERISEFEEILGYHLERAGRYILELGSAEGVDLTRAHEAATYLSAAGRRALARGDVAAATNLLERAAALLPARAAARLQLLPDLVDAAMEGGDFNKASLASDEALALAEATGDRRVALRARTAQLSLHLQTEPQLTIEEARSEAEQLLVELDKVGDDLGLGRCWFLLSQLVAWLGDSAAAERGLDRASAHAREAGDHRTENQALAWTPLVLAFGPTGTEETVRRCDALLQRFPEKGQLQAFALVGRGMSLGMRGHIDEARTSVARGRGILQDLGMVVSWGATSFVSAIVELPHDPAGAERELRDGHEILEKKEETAFLSLVAAFLGEALFQQGRADEARAMTVTSETLAAPDDFASQAVWRAVRAKVLAGRGEFDQADALAREAVELLDSTDWLLEKGFTQLAHAEVDLIAHRDDQAVAKLQRARETFELKGANLWAAKVRALQKEQLD